MAVQALLSPHASLRLRIDKLPVIELDGDEVLGEVCRRSDHNAEQVIHATNTKTAQLLMTAMRDASVAGPLLRESHRRVGWYLAMTLLPQAIGLDSFPLRHVQGTTTTGHCLRNEQSTMIVALMRGGEPIALGINDAHQAAKFLHGREPKDVKLHHVRSCRNFILVDSVVNTGRSVVDFVKHIRKLDGSVRIVVVAGVIQAQSISTGILAEALDEHPDVRLVALRLSQNKYTGQGGTDTGNRLFNTTDLP